jgi:hypothetical protein
MLPYDPSGRLGPTKPLPDQITIFEPIEPGDEDEIIPLQLPAPVVPLQIPLPE